MRATPTSLVVEVGQAVIRVPRGFDGEHLCQVVQALSEEPGHDPTRHSDLPGCAHDLPVAKVLSNSTPAAELFQKRGVLSPLPIKIEACKSVVSGVFCHGSMLLLVEQAPFDLRRQGQ